MATDFGVLYPLWDFVADEGRLLESLAGEVGIDHLTIPVVTGAQNQFRLGCGGETPHFHTEGGWHFRMSTKAYATAALRPHKAKWFAGADALAQIRAQAAEHNIRILLRLDLRPVRALVDQERHLCQRNAWGQEVPFAGACACNPDLRELLRATLEDLRRYEPAGFEIVNWVPDSAEDRFAVRPVAWNPPARRLLDICFCASCRQVAERDGVDAEAAARSVRVQVESAMTSPMTPPHRPEDDPVLSAYIAARVGDCRQWLHRLAEGDGERRRLLVGNYGEPVLGQTAPWVRMTRVSAAVCASADADTWVERLRDLPELGALALSVWRPAFREASELVRLLAEAVRTGISTIDFEGLTEAAPEAITWLKQAVRFARRS